MLRNRYVIAGGIIGILIVANIINWFLSGWGLITVTVKDAPLGQVIKSIERQGWVTIYTNLPLDTKVTMYVLKVPLPDAMDALANGLPDSGQWNLGFFAAPTSSGVKQEIRDFQIGATSDDTKTYSYGTPMDMLSDPDSDGLPAADPYRQVWTGYHAPPPAPVTADGGNGGGNPPADPPAPPSTLQDYFQVTAEEANVWIMAPGSWSPPVPAPPANISISRAVKNLVGNARGAVEQAVVLRSRSHHIHGGDRDSGFAGGDTGWFYLQDRINNEIHGLPPEVRPQATQQLAAENQFRQSLLAAPPEQRFTMMRDHFMSHMSDNLFKRSPEKRAQMYARVVANRQAAQGK